MKGWCDHCKDGGPREQCTKGRMTTEQLIQHLKSEKGCVYHRFMTNYLELYFCKNKGTYLGLENVGHYSFYGKIDPKRQRSFENENEFLIFKAKDDTRKLKLRNEKEAKEAAAKVKTSSAQTVKTVSVAVASVAVSTMSTLTQEGQPVTNSSTRKKQNRAVKQRIKRKAEQQTEPDKYSKILVLGLSHSNKFTHEFQARVDEGSSRTDYALSNGKTTPSKDVPSDGIGYIFTRSCLSI